jgi:hypothetical protein
MITFLWVAGAITGFITLVVLAVLAVLAICADSMDEVDDRESLYGEEI